MMVVSLRWGAAGLIALAKPRWLAWPLEVVRRENLSRNGITCQNKGWPVHEPSAVSCRHVGGPAFWRCIRRAPHGIEGCERCATNAWQHRPSVQRRNVLVHSEQIRRIIYLETIDAWQSSCPR